MNNDDNRPRGILSPADREYLAGETEYEHRQTEYVRRNDIQTRVTEGLADLVFLAEHTDHIDDRLAEIDPDDWTAALHALRQLHPEAPEKSEPEFLRAIAQELTATADQIHHYADSKEEADD